MRKITFCVSPIYVEFGSTDDLISANINSGCTLGHDLEETALPFLARQINCRDTALPSPDFG